MFEQPKNLSKSRDAFLLYLAATIASIVIFCVCVGASAYVIMCVALIVAAFCAVKNSRCVHVLTQCSKQ